MKTSRRRFLQNTAFTVAGSVLLQQKLFAAPTKGEVMGIQLYSVRDDMSADPLATLKKLSAIGYRYVEHANYVDRKFYGYAAADFKKVLADNNLQMRSGHTVLNFDKHWDSTTKDFTDTWKFTVEDAATVGQEFVISPWLDDSVRKSMDKVKEAMDIFNKSGELCKKSGMKFGYHNHDFEFNTKVDDKLLYDLILENTDSTLVIQQMDIGNMYGAGGRALEIVKKYPGRFESMHVKDEIKSDAKDTMEGYESTVLGKGVVGTKAIIDLGRKIGGTKHFIIEQESYQGKTPLECAKEDFVIMKQWGY